LILARDRIVFEFSLKKPDFGSIAREADRKKFIMRMLSFINPILRQMYGLDIQRSLKRAGGNTYFIRHTDVGNLFIFADEPEPDDIRGGPRPHISSKLKVIEPDKTGLFLEEEYYDRISSKEPRDGEFEEDYTDRNAFIDGLFDENASDGNASDGNMSDEDPVPPVTHPVIHLDESYSFEDIYGE